MYKVVPLGSFLKQPRIKCCDDTHASSSSDDVASNSSNASHDPSDTYQQELFNYVVLMNRISSDVSTMGALGYEAAIYIRFYYMKRYNSMSYPEFKKYFLSGVDVNMSGCAASTSKPPKSAGLQNIRVLPPDFGALIRHLCIGDASLSATSSTMDPDYAVVRRRANIKHKYNIRLRAHLVNDLVDKYTWFFRQHVIQSAKLLMITYFEEFYIRFVPDTDQMLANNLDCVNLDNDSDDDNTAADAQNNNNNDSTKNNFNNNVYIKMKHHKNRHTNNNNSNYQYQLLNLEVLMLALFSRPGHTRHTDSMVLKSNGNRVLYKNYQRFFHQMFPDDPLMDDIDICWYKYVPFLLKVQSILLNVRPQTPVETLFPTFIDTRHFIKYDDRAIIDLLTATNLYVPGQSSMLMATAPPPLTYGAAAALSVGDTIPQWGKLTRKHCQQFFECGIDPKNPQYFCNFVTDGVTCFRMLVAPKDECRSKATNLWSNNCCSHQYTTRRQLLSLDEFHNPSHGHFSIYSYGTHLLKDYTIFAEEKLFRLQLNRLKITNVDSPINALCNRCRHFVV